MAGVDEGCSVVAQHKKVRFRELFAISRYARGIPSVLYRQHFGTIFPSRTRHMAGLRAAALLCNITKKSDFVSYSLYLALHEGFLRYYTGSISVRYLQVARGVWQTGRDRRPTTGYMDSEGSVSGILGF